MSKRASAPEIVLNILGPELRRLRRAAKVTQEDLAARLSVKGWTVRQDVIALIETGQRTLTDRELLLVLRVLRKKLSDVQEPKDLKGARLPE